MRRNTISNRLPLNLQYFAGEEGGTDATDQAAGGGKEANAGGQAAGQNPTDFDTFLKDPKNQAEFDRRVSKALDTSRSKMQAEIEEKVNAARTEAEKLARMNAEQKAQYEREKRENGLKQREAEITRRELSAEAKETLADKGLPTQLAEILNYENADTCKASIEAVEKSFSEAVQKAVEEKLKGGNPMKKAPEGARTYTKEEISRMSPQEINNNWDQIKASMIGGL
jgi:hypothetical protein